MTVLLLPDARSGSLRVGVSVPPADASTGRLDARAVLRQVLAVTGGRGGGSPEFAHGGGAGQADLRAVTGRIRAAFGIQEDSGRAG